MELTVEQFERAIDARYTGKSPYRPLETLQCGKIPPKKLPPKGRLRDSYIRNRKMADEVIRLYHDKAFSGADIMKMMQAITSNKTFGNKYKCKLEECLLEKGYYMIYAGRLDPHSTRKFYRLEEIK